MYTSMLSLLLLASTTLAAPAYRPRNFLSDVSTITHDLQNATVKGVENTIKQSVNNPALSLARVEVVKGIKDTKAALEKVNSQAKSDGNKDVCTLVKSGNVGLGQSQQAIDRIGQSLISGQTPSINDQKLVAEGIKQTQFAIQCMTGAIKNQDDQLSTDVSAATTAVGGLRNGGESVISSQKKTFSDLGLPADFDQGTPNCQDILSGKGGGSDTQS